MTLEQATESIADLVERFARNADAYHRQEYNEETARAVVALVLRVALDGARNALVYELHGLTEEEIAAVEGSDRR